MTAPAGNRAWIWEWEGFTAPTPYDWTEEDEKSFKEFFPCFDHYAGIGDFSYWIKAELNKLSKSQKDTLRSLIKNYWNRVDNEYETKGNKK